MRSIGMPELLVILVSAVRRKEDSRVGKGLGRGNQEFQRFSENGNRRNQEAGIGLPGSRQVEPAIGFQKTKLGPRAKAARGFVFLVEQAFPPAPYHFWPEL